MPTEPHLPPEAFSTLYDQMLDLWIRPELERRGQPGTEHNIRQALVQLIPGRQPRIELDEEAEFIAQVEAARPIEKGDPVTTADITRIHSIAPGSLDPNAGWIGFTTVGDQRWLMFDFRRNRETARVELRRAKEFLAIARLSLGSSIPVALENAFAAAELAVTAEMHLMHDRPTKVHPEKRRWYKQWSELGNAPEAGSRALAELGKHRSRARYATGPVQIDAQRVAELVEAVEDLVDHVEQAVGDG